MRRSRFEYSITCIYTGTPCTITIFTWSQSAEIEKRKIESKEEKRRRVRPEKEKKKPILLGRQKKKEITICLSSHVPTVRTVRLGIKSSDRKEVHLATGINGAHY